MGNQTLAHLNIKSESCCPICYSHVVILAWLSNTHRNKLLMELISRKRLWAFALIRFLFPLTVSTLLIGMSNKVLFAQALLLILVLFSPYMSKMSSNYIVLPCSLLLCCSSLKWEICCTSICQPTSWFSVPFEPSSFTYRNKKMWHFNIPTGEVTDFYYRNIIHNDSWFLFYYQWKMEGKGGFSYTCEEEEGRITSWSSTEWESLLQDCPLLFSKRKDCD